MARITTMASLNNYKNTKLSKPLLFGLLSLLLTTAYSQDHVWINTNWLDIPVDAASKPPEDDANREAGRIIYHTKCYFCHGDKGDGLGRSEVSRMDPRPRDFTSGKFKFKTVPGDEAPTDEDLYRTISRGVVGTAMPFWTVPNTPSNWDNYRYLLAPKERWQVIYYVKSMSDKFKYGLELKVKKLKADLEKAEPKSKEARRLKKLVKIYGKRLKKYEKNREKFPPLQIGPGPQVTPDLIEQGRKLFAEEGAGCAKCHGLEGRGEAMERKDDDWGFPIVAANLTRPANFKGGNGMREVFRTISTGLLGTPMPSTLGMFSSDASEDEQKRWAIAAYVHSLSESSHSQVESSKTVLSAKQIQGALPTDPDDPAWESADVIEATLTGQVMVEPRQWWPSVNYVTVKALYNEDKVAFHLAWDDRTKSLSKGNETSNSYSDSVHIQLPLEIPDGPVKPHFFLGGPGKPVNLWRYQANWETDKNRQSPVEEQTAAGSRSAPKPHAPESQLVAGKGVYKNGQWKVVMIRPLRTEDEEKDTQFIPGKLIPISFAVADGDNGDHGNKVCVSTWYYLVLTTETPSSVYLWTLIAVLCACGVEYWVVKKAGN